MRDTLDTIENLLSQGQRSWRFPRRVEATANGDWGRHPAFPGLPRSLRAYELQSLFMAHEAGDGDPAESARADRLLEDLHRQARLESLDGGDGLFVYGDLLIELGRLKEALHHYERAAAYSTSPRDTHIWVGAALVRGGFHEAADSAFEQASALGPLTADSEAMWGTAMYKMKDFVAASGHFKRATLLDPRHANVYYDYALSLERSGQISEALVEYRKAVKLDPDHPAAARLLRLEQQEP